jgi:uncharacterized protein
MALETDYLIGVFLKNHHCQPVKTRLAKSIGVENAREIYTLMIKILLDTLAGFPRERVHLAVMGGGEGLDYPYPMEAQSSGDLGEKMSKFFQDKLSKFSRVLLIGTDCPYTSVEPLSRALTELEHSEAVFQPAFDGGYTLIGLRSFIPALFQEIPWSSERVMGASRQILSQSEISFSELDCARDIDTWEDLQLWFQETDSRILDQYFCEGEVSSEILRLRAEALLKSSSQ